jgi:hypothetical protein
MTEKEIEELAHKCSAHTILNISLKYKEFDKINAQDLGKIFFAEFFAAIHEGQREGAKWALKNQWVSVKDRLPELDKDGISNNVFIHGSGGYVGSAFYWDNTFFSWDGQNEIHGVDYWMPIPEIEEEEKK